MHYVSAQGVDERAINVRYYYYYYYDDDDRQKDLGSNPLRLSFLFESCGLRDVINITMT